MSSSPSQERPDNIHTVIQSHFEDLEWLGISDIAQGHLGSGSTFPIQIYPVLNQLLYSHKLTSLNLWATTATHVLIVDIPNKLIAWLLSNWSRAAQSGVPEPKLTHHRVQLCSPEVFSKENYEF